MPEPAKVAAIRALLPATGAGIYLNAGSAGPMSSEVQRAMDEQAQRDLAVGLGLHDALPELLERLGEARAAVAAVLVADPDDIALTHGASDGLNLAVVALPAWTLVSRSRKAAFVAEALPRIERLAREGDYPAAVELAREVERAGGAGTVSAELWKSAANEVSVESQPAGASIAYRRFPTQDRWSELGATPAKVRVPRGPLHWRA